jgi:hypothetical protein
MLKYFYVICEHIDVTVLAEGNNVYMEEIYTGTEDFYVI